MQEEKIAELYKKIIKPNFRILDIGGYDGTHSEILCTLAYEGYVDCFEPNPTNFEIIQNKIDALFFRRHIDFIKIDVEGAENLVINGGLNTIEYNKPIMIIEFHNDEGWRGARPLFAMGYKIIDVFNVIYN